MREICGARSVIHRDPVVLGMSITGNLLVPRAAQNQLGRRRAAV